MSSHVVNQNPPPHISLFHTAVHHNLFITLSMGPPVYNTIDGAQAYFHVCYPSIFCSQLVWCGDLTYMFESNFWKRTIGFSTMNCT